MKLLYISFILLVGAGLASCAGYTDLKSEIEGYQPPDSFLSASAPQPASRKPEKGTMPDASLQTVRRMKNDWRSISDPKNRSYAFFQPSPELLQRLKPVAEDEKAVAGFLRHGFSLETLEAVTLLRNPGVKAAERSLSAEIQSFPQVAEMDENLRQYAAFTQGLMTGAGPMKGKDSVQMKFPFPGVTALKGEIVNQSVEAAREEVSIAEREAVTSVRKLYWNLIFLRNARRIDTETLEQFRRLESVADTRYRAGKTGFQDVIKVSIRTRMLEEELVTLKEKENNLRAGLRELLNLAPDTPIDVPAEASPPRSTPSLDALFEKAKNNRQELRRMRAMIGKTERMIEMAETMILPPMTLNFSLSENDTLTESGFDAMKPAFAMDVSASRGLGLPRKPWFGTENAWLDQTRQSLDAKRETLKKAEAATDKMVRNAWFELDKAVREANLLEQTIADLARSALDVSTRGYESGAVSFADVIGSYTDWLDVRLALARKISGIGAARAEIGRVTGISLSEK